MKPDRSESRELRRGGGQIPVDGILIDVCAISAVSNSHSQSDVYFAQVRAIFTNLMNWLTS
jgi:hypothetical protein